MMSSGDSVAIPPVLFDSRRRVLIGPPTTPAEEALFADGATEVLRDPRGVFLGVNVDNETPDRDKVAAEMVAQLPGKLITVGLYPDEPSKRLPGCVCMFEEYPFYGETSMGMPERWNLGVRRFGRMPEAWILQWNFAWTTQEMDRNYPPPTPEQRQSLLSWVQKHYSRAKQIWLY